MNAREAANSVQHLAKQYKAVLNLAGYLQEIGSVENAAAEAEKRRDEAIRARNTAEHELANVRAEIEQARLSAQGILNAARVEAHDIAEKASADLAKVGNEVEAKRAELQAATQEFQRIEQALADARSRLGV